MINFVGHGTTSLPFDARAYRGSEIHKVEELLEHCDHQVELPVGEELSNRRLVILDKEIFGV